MSRSVPMKSWVWDGHPGQLIVSHDCEFALNTRIGGFRISTIGDWFPVGWPRGAGMRGKEIGFNRTHETFVFRVSGSGPGELDSLGEIDSLVYNDCEDARKGHLKMCRKYARIAREEP